MAHKIMPALFLDLDGTVRKSKTGGTFIAGADDVELIPGMESRIATFKKMGFLIVAISNQGGVAFGHKSIMQVQEELSATLGLFETGNPFDLVQICPHMEGGTVAPYNVRSLFRKPDIGMLVKSEEDAFKHGMLINWDLSLFVGDRNEDRECAGNAKIPFSWAHDFVKWVPEFSITDNGPAVLNLLMFDRVPRETQEMERINRQQDAELKIVHECLTDVYNHVDTSISLVTRIKLALDEIETLNEESK